MKQSAMSGLISLAVLVVASVLILWGMNSISTNVMQSNENGEIEKDLSGIISAADFKEIQTSGNNINKAYSCLDKDANVIGYAVYVMQKGYNGDILSCVIFETDKKTVKGVRVLEQSETEQLGAKVAEQDFLSRFNDKQTPIGAGSGVTTLKDGTYKAYENEFDSGYRYFVEMKIENGKITSVNWDAEAEKGGKNKKQASKDGEYVMTEDGLLWHEQAQLIENKLLETQKITSIEYDENGKTDAITGVSVSINSFAKLASQCLDDAGASQGEGVETITGATVSSKAVIESVNLAAEFLKDGVQ